MQCIKQVNKKSLDRQRRGIVALLDADRMKEPQKIIRKERNEYDVRVKEFIRKLDDGFGDSSGEDWVYQFRRDEITSIRGNIKFHINLKVSIQKSWITFLKSLYMLYSIFKFLKS